MGKGPRRGVRRLLSAAGTLLLLVLCTEILLRLRAATGERPYTILYLIPVAIGAALMGVRGGLVAALLAVLLARIYLFNDQKQGTELLLSFPNVAELIEFGALLMGTLTIAAVTGYLRSTMGKLRDSSKRLELSYRQLEEVNHQLGETNARLEQTNARLHEAEEQRRVFHRDVLLAVTGGKLRLVEPGEMPPPDLVSGAPRLTLPLWSSEDASALRRALQRLGHEMGLEGDRLFDLCTGVTEAATNAVKHGGGGEAHIWADEEAIGVQITDRGEGIAPAMLARATLEQGYSSRVSLGMGFHMILQTTDVLVMATGPNGTSLLLRVLIGTRVSPEEALLARYVGL